MVSNQVVTVGMGEVIDIDIKAVDVALDLYDILNRKEVFEKVVSTARYFIREMREKQKI